MIVILCLLSADFGHRGGYIDLAAWAGIRSMPVALFPLNIKYTYSAMGYYDDSSLKPYWILVISFAKVPCSFSCLKKSQKRYKEV